MKKLLKLLLFVPSLYCSLVNAQWVQTNAVGSSNTDYLDVDFINDSVGFVSFSYGTAVIMKTTDYGQNWTPVNNQSMMFTDKIDFVSPRAVYNVEVGRVTRSIDGGTNWSVVKQGNIREYLNNLHFENFQTGYVISRQILSNPPSLVGLIHKTTNAGISWTTDTFPNTSKLIGIDFPSADTGYVSGYSGGSGGSGQGTIIRTYDAGATWIKTIYPDIGNINGIHFVNNNVGYAVGQIANGYSNKVMKTIDAGQNWSFINPHPIGVTNSDELNAVFFTSSDTGYVGGRNSLFLETTNGGATWTSIPTVGDVNEIYFPTKNIGLMLGNDGQFLRMDRNAITTSIEKFEVDEHVSVYPNPASSHLFIKSDFNILEISITNSIGKRFYNGIFNKNEHAIDISKFKSGFYFVSIKNDSHTFIKKVIISN